MSYTIKHIAEITGASFSDLQEDRIEHIVLDSRKIHTIRGTLFFALKGERRDGHLFIPQLYEQGIRNFIVCGPIHPGLFPGANFLHVADTLYALQLLAAYHRRQFDIPVIGITGSNGKTIVKEWLYQLLEEDFAIVRSPKSYNSQIGVPLSIWQMDSSHTLAIFEAGISRPGEMARLATMIQPTIGILTNIGAAHREGFSSDAEKEREKRILLEHTTVPQKLQIESIRHIKEGSSISARFPDGGDAGTIEIPFTDEASIQNAVTCWELMLLMGYSPGLIRERMAKLAPVHMRMELKKGINHCTLINDSYSADLSSMEIALNFLEQQNPNERKTVILSDFLESAMEEPALYRKLLEMLLRKGIQRLIGIGPGISTFFSQGIPEYSREIIVKVFRDPSDFFRQMRSTDFREETILIKGARKFHFEEIAQWLELKSHQTVLEVNLNSLVHNLKAFTKKLQPETKVMAMVKAFAYGSGAAEIAGILQYHKVDYLGVAYADEGVELRKAGIHLPIMVMNPEESSFDLIYEYNLEPEIYSFRIMESFDSFLKRESILSYPVHVEIETGMNRLGFSPNEMARLARAFSGTNSMVIKSVFSHLASGEDPSQDDFTEQQAKVFMEAIRVLNNEIPYPFIRHIANSAAVIRHPHLHMDMVRLGIGLYGVKNPGSESLNIQPVATLKSTVAQVKKIKKGESVSYNRRGILERDSVIATVRMGYADGFPRRLGNGAGKVLVRGEKAPVIGTVCMDMFMIDVTDIDGIEEGDEVIIFGSGLSLQEMSEDAGTIPYEIMTGISQRVRRVYFEE